MKSICLKHLFNIKYQLIRLDSKILLVFFRNHLQGVLQKQSIEKNFTLLNKHIPNLRGIFNYVYVLLYNIN